MTFEELCEIEPRLTELERKAKAAELVKYDRQFCANAYWADAIKPALTSLVGWDLVGEADDRLKTMEAYNLTYDHLYSLLPNCNQCGCVRSYVA
ncbi:hypothetical protein [Rosistilla oblonga]|uniref:hypothetical protein n=1 Tax=Rosistilla oblonga TaxID=2527990 RepID=UPI003A979E29